MPSSLPERLLIAFSLLLIPSPWLPFEVHAQSSQPQYPQKIEMQTSTQSFEMSRREKRNAKNFSHRKHDRSGYSNSKKISGIVVPSASGLHAAIQFRSPERVKQYLAQGMPVDMLGASGETPLMYAAQTGQEDIFHLLRQHGANIHATDPRGLNLLHYAAIGGIPSIFQELLQENLNPRTQDQNDYTPFLYAVRAGSHEIISLLVDQGVDLHQRFPKSGLDLLQVASKNGHHKTVELLLNFGVPIRPAGISLNQRSPLQWAAKNGHPHVVQILLAHNARVEELDAQGNTPLLLSSQKGKLDVTRLLLEHQAQVNVQNKNGDTPLLLASKQGHQEVVQILLKFQAQADVQNTRAETPLGVASNKGHDKVVSLLLETGVKPHSYWLGVPPLGLAARRGHVEAVRILVENGADPDAIIGNDGFTPLMSAIRSFYNSSKNEHYYDTVSYLLKKGTGVDTKSRTGMTALMLASDRHKGTIMVKLLLAQGANPNLQNNEGETALFRAIFADNLETIQALILGGADVTLKTVEGETPRMKAQKLSDHVYRKKVLELLEHG